MYNAYYVNKENTVLDFHKFVVRYKPEVERLSFQFGIVTNNIEEVVQEVFYNLYYVFKEIDGDTEWLSVYQTAYKTIKAYLKKQQKPETSFVIHDQQLGYFFEKKPHHVLHVVFQDLNINLKAPLIFYFFHNLSMDEIAQLLKMNTESVNVKIDRGKRIIRKMCGKVREWNSVALVNELEKSLYEMKYVYDVIPEFCNTDGIIQYIELRKNKNSWKKRLPTFIAVIGLLFFFSIAIFYLQEEKKELAREKERTLQEKRYNEKMEIDTVEESVNPEILAYLEEKKKKLALEFGLADANQFSIVSYVSDFIEDMNQHSGDDFYGSLEEVKELIDYFLTPPSKWTRDLDASKENGDKSLVQLLNSYNIYKFEFQEYLSQHLTKHQIMIDDYDAIVLAQEDLEGYKGPKEIKQLIKIIREQGFYLTHDTEILTVQIDYQYLKEKTSEAGFHKGYIEYIRFSENVKDFYTDGHWKNIDTDLLALEGLIIKYGEIYSNEFRKLLAQEISSYLSIYLTGGNEPKPLMEEKEEFYQFLHNNPNSIFYGAVEEAIKDWEANEWQYTSQDYPNYNRIEVMLDPRFQNVGYSDIYDLNKWPFIDNTTEVYKEYASSFDRAVLQGLSPIELTSLYIYSYQKKDKAVFTSINSEYTIKNSEKMDWWDIKDKSNLVAVQYPTKESATIYFLGWHEDIQIIATMDMVKVNGVWKISGIE
ncbi:sigma-70 family RNA polymerase sigma factor [Ornithinibacillus bavariensis]|uniref:sigma-70 family RNA polymerase sigma factor n=1 Tax=Ornithinibacillus bavariensis TaxID=545502 RepID=UPI003D24B24E